MATKMTAETAKRVKNLGIEVKSEEEARKKLLKILEDNDISGMEDEDTATLIEIAESFSDEDNNEEKPEEVTEEDEADELAKEVEEEAEEAAEEAEEEESIDDDADALASMSRTELKAYIKEKKLDIKVKKSWSDDDIREKIRESEGDDKESKEPEEKKAEPAKKAEKKEKPAKKEEKKAEKKIGKRGKKLDPKNNEDDRAEFECLKELFPEDEYEYAWVASAGVTIKHIGKNSRRAMVLLENCSKQEDGSIKCNLYLLTFTKQTEVLDKAEIEYSLCWSGAPFLKGISMTEAIEVINKVMPNILATVQKIDKKLGENRVKMEESLKKTSKKEVKAETESEEKPAKKTVKK